MLPPMSSEFNSVESSQDSAVCVTLGSGPKRCSWCSPLQLGIPRGHWSGGINESLWPCEPRRKLENFTPAFSCAEWPSQGHFGGLQRQPAAWMGRHCLEGPSLRSGGCVPDERQWLQRGLCRSFGIRRGGLRMQPCHRLLRKKPFKPHKERHQKFPFPRVSPLGSRAWVSTYQPQFGLFLVQHLKETRFKAHQHPLYQESIESWPL